MFRAHVFQFFPSCFLNGVHSFTLKYLTQLSILSQLLRDPLLREGVQIADFQFFPSCFMDRRWR